MRYADFAALAARAAGSPPARCAVAGAADEHAIEAVLAAQRRGWVHPVFIGDVRATAQIVAGLGYGDDRVTYVPCDAGRNPAEAAVDLVRDGKADFLLKGRITTRDLLRPVLDRQTGLNDSGFVTHFGLMQIAGYPRLLAMSDAAVIPYPTVEDKRRIVTTCAAALARLGIDRPVVAALCAVEVVNPRMPETVEAHELALAAERGELGDVVVVGPVSYDLATSRRSAAIKGYACPYAGEVDMLLVPQLVTGNVMSKIWNADPRNVLAGCLVGTRVPVALTSRSAGTAEKLHSMLLCSLLSGSAHGPVHGPVASRASDVSEPSDLR